MSVLNIESAGFQALEHRFNGPSLLIRRKGLLGFAEGHEDLRFRLPGLVLDHSSGQVAKFATDAVDTMQYLFFTMTEVSKDMLGADMFSGPGIFYPEVVADADMVLDGIVIEPLEPFVSDELTVGNEAFDAILTEQADEPLHDVYPLLVIGISPFGQQPEQDGERHMIISYA